MYLARFAIDQQSYVQGAATLAFPFDQARSERTSGWSRQILHIATSLASFAPSWVALRLDFDGRQIVRHLIVTAEASRADSLLYWMAALSRLEREAPGSVLLAATVDDHDRVLARGSADVRSIIAPVFGYAGIDWIEQPARLLDVLDDVFERATMDSRRLGYQAVLAPYRPAKEMIRRLRRDVLRLEELPGFGVARLSVVRKTIDRYCSSQWHLSETAWLHESDAETWLTNRIEESCRRVGMDPPSVIAGGLWEDGAAEGVTLHPQSDPTRLTDVGAAIGEDALVRLLSWQPSLLPSAMLSRPDPSLSSDVGPVLSEPPEVNESFLFISYARRDASRVTVILDDLTRIGVEFWYDQHIPGGDSWVNDIERRLERCRAVLLFLSPASAVSRYVRSEATFAYTLGKPIFLVSLQPTDPPAGLRIILAGLQQTSVDDPRLLSMIEKFCV
jgi:hypothetical protein